MTVTALSLLITIAACAAPERAPEPVAATGAAPAAAETIAFPAEPTLADVLAHVAEAPAVEIARAEAAASEGLVEQADLPPNPVLGLRGRLEPTDVSDGMRKASVGVAQRFETAGKREKRVAVAAAEGEAAARDVDAARLRVAGAAALAHQQALAARAVSAARREALAVARDILARARSLVDAGRAEEGILPVLLAGIGRLRVAVADAERDERTALRRLERVLARPAGSVTGVAGDLLAAPDLPAPAALDFAAHPEVAALRAAEETARARTRSAEALATPDVTVGLDVESSRERERSATTVGVGVELPLPVFDRNQGAIRAARADERRAAAATADAMARLAGAYAEAYEEIVSLTENLATYDDEILPALRDDLERARAAETAGRTDRGPVLAARAALAASRTVRAELAARLAARTVDALTLLDRLD